MKRNRTIGAGFLVLIVFVLNYMLRFVPTASVAKDVDPYLTISVLQLLVYMIPTLIYTKLRFSERTQALRLRLFGPRCLIFIFAVICAMILGSTLINYGMHTLFPDSYQASSDIAQAVGDATSVSGGLYAITAFAIIPAICEEYLFRSVVCAEFECAGVGSAVLFSTLFFAMGHFSIIRLPVYIFSGVALVFVMYATRSVFASMVAHAVSNAVSLFVEGLVYKVVNRQGIVIFIAICAALFLVFAALSFSEAQKLYRRMAEENQHADYRIPKKDRVNILEAALCPPVIATVAFFLIMSIAV